MALHVVELEREPIAVERPPRIGERRAATVVL